MRFLLAVVAVVALAGMADGPTLETLGRLDDLALREVSGIARSPKHPGVYWVINDSGNPPALFAVKRDGSLVRKLAVKVPNLDWEDLTFDDDGRLYIGDIGNNNTLFPMRVIYRLDEPDPSASGSDPLPVTTASYYRFPAGGRFDAEGLFVDRGRAVLVAKYLDRREAELFAVPFAPPAPLTKPAAPERLGRLSDCNEPVTGAALSRDHKRLAVCSYAVVRIYQRGDTEKDDWKPLAVVPFAGDGLQIEAICWDGADLILAGEARGLFRIAEERWKKSAVR